MRSILIKLIWQSLNGLSYISKSYATDKALELFSRPRKGQITESQASFLDTAIKEQLSYNTNHIMTYKWGNNGATILLVHGWESNSARWRPLINHLKNSNYTVVTLDAPAHGNSGSSTFNALLYAEYIKVVAEKFQPTCIIGHSVGGMSSVIFQNKYQLKSLKKMVLLAVPSEFKNVLKHYTDMLGYNRRVIKHLNQIIEEQFGAPPESFSTATYVKNVDCKGLIIHDEEDKIIAYGEALLIKANFKNSKLITTKGLGHSLNHKMVITEVSKFIDT